MIKPALPTNASSHVMAILKGAIVIVLGRRTMYLRKPSELADEQIQTYTHGLHVDLLAGTNKNVFAEHKQGNSIVHASFDADVPAEKHLMKKWLPRRQSRVREGRASQG